MRVLALDIGSRRTGVAYLDEETNIPLPLETLSHKSEIELLSKLESLIRERKIGRLIVGLPLLLSGKEGSQAKFVRDVMGKLNSLPVTVSFIDERFSTPSGKTGDPDAYAAWNLLQTAYPTKID